MLRRAVLSLALITACLGFAGSAQALYMEGGQSTEGIGAFYGYIWYLPASETEAELWVVLTNASDRANGGCITGFVLNNPGNRITSVARGEDFPAAFNILGAANPYDGIKASPFGRFDLGACLGKSFLGGGNPTAGIPAVDGEDTMTFRFLLNGIGLDQLYDSDFAMTLSAPQGKDLEQSFLVVRFKGCDNDGSDKLASVFSWELD